MSLVSPEVLSEPRRAPPWWQGSWVVVVGLVLVVGTLACYWPAGRQGFVLYEDPLTVSQNPMIQQGVNGPSILWAFKSIVTCNWQPLTSLSHMLDWQLWEGDAGKHHLVSVGLHTLNVLLLFGLLRRLTGSTWRSGFVAGLFGWHPMHVESVAWISERKDVLSACFFLLTLWAYAEYVRSGEARGDRGDRGKGKGEDGGWRMAGQGNAATRNPQHATLAIGWYLLALLCFSLGLMSKPNIVTLPFVLLLLDYWPLGRVALPERILKMAGVPVVQPAVRAPHWSRLVLEKLPFLALTVADCAVTFMEQKAYGSLPTLEMFPVSMRLENALISYVFYLGRLFWPTHMGVFYLFPHAIPVGQAVGAALVLAGVTAGVVWQMVKRPYLAVGWFWFLGILVPMIGLVQTGVQSRADHHTYLAYVGLGVMLAWGVPAWLSELARRRPGAMGAWQTGLGLASVAVLGACWFGARTQLGYWRDSVTLFQHTVAVTQANEAGHNMLGAALLQEGHRDEAAQQFQETLKIQPFYATFRGRAYDNLGMLCLQRHQLDEAIGMLTEALKLQPDSPGTRFNLGAAYGQQGQLEKAAAEFQRVADMPPGNDVELNDADLQLRVSRALIRCGKGEEALKHCHELVAAHPEDPALRSVLAGVCQLLNRPEEAITNLREAVRRAPRTTAYMNQLAGLLATCAEARLRNGTEAVGLAERAVELSHHRNAAFLDTLGMAYAEAHRFPEAIRAGEEAWALVQASSDHRGAEAVGRKLELYRAGRAYHEMGGN